MSIAALIQFITAGGWGKPPVDEAGKPLYGDVFGTSDSRNFPAAPTEDVRLFAIFSSHVL